MLYKESETIKLLLGDCLREIKTIPDNSIDSIVTDPPYELGFMGKSWDSTGIANNVDMWRECLRVLKPGGHLLAFSGTRTYHRMASAIEDAGFEVRDMIEWVYGSGFPKSLNIGKAVDRLGGQSLSWFIDYILKVADEKGISRKELTMLFPSKNGNPTGWLWNKQKTQGITLEQYHKIKEFLQLPFADITECEREIVGRGKAGLTAGTIANFTGEKEFDLTKGTSEWEGWGTALKPAHEPICMARKPLGEKTVAENCLKWGTGGINIDESRVEHNEECKMMKAQTDDEVMTGRGKYGQAGRRKDVLELKPTGRFPANLIHDNSEEVRECFPETGSVKGRQTQYSESDFAGDGGWKGAGIGQRTYDGSGNASRFFKSIIYQAKSSKSERNKGLDSIVLVDILRVWNENNTTKEEKLIRLMVTGISPQKVIGESGVQLKNANEWNTCLFGKHLMEKYQEDIKSITKTETNSITTSQILNWLIHLLTNEYIVGANLEMENGGNLVANAENSNTLIFTINETMALALGVKDVVSGTQLKINVKEGSNIHSTVKPIALMEYLIKMVTPKGGVVLDPFNGSGTTGIACQNTGNGYIGIELNEEYLVISLARLGL